MKEDSRGPAYRVETERLLMRCWDPKDAPRLREALDASDAHLRPFIPWMKLEPRSMEDTIAWLRRNRADFDGDVNYRYAIFDRSGETLFGETSLFRRVGEGGREVGYWLDVRQGRKGYAMEASKAMIRVGFEVEGVDRIEIHCSPDNEASVAIPKKLGFHHEGTLRRRFLDSEDNICDTMVWTLFASDYPSSPPKDLPVAAFDIMEEKLL